MGEARRDKSGSKLGDCESEGDDEKQRACLGMGDVELLLNERHQRRKNETSHEIQKKEGGNEEDRAGSSAKGFWNGA